VGGIALDTGNVLLYLYKEKQPKEKMLIEKNREGAIVIFGDIGRRIYYYYSKKEALQKYKKEMKGRK